MDTVTLTLETFEERYFKGEDVNSILKSYAILSEQVFSKYLVSRNLISIDKALSIPSEYLEKYAFMLDPKTINYFLKKKTYSQHFICEYKDKLDWSLVITTQKLTTDTMNKCKDYLIWFLLPNYQTLSPKFIIENITVLPLAIVLDKQTLPQDTKEKILAFLGN